MLKRQVDMESTTDVVSLLDDHGANIGVVPYLLQRAGKDNYSLADNLRAVGNWRLVFWDDDGMVWARDTPANAELIKRRDSVIFPEHLPCRENLRANGSELVRLRKDPDKWGRAGDELERAVAESPRNFRATMALAIWHDVNSSTPTVTLAAFRKAEEMDPTLPELLNRMGQFFARQGEKEKALDYFSRAARYASSRADGLFNQALTSYKFGYSEEALGLVNRVLRLSPFHQQARRLKERIRGPATKPGSSDRGTTPSGDLLTTPTAVLTTETMGGDANL
ncbi:MAG: hypothetical protein K1X53_04340 [Candidatus Sumerlaeaceae bacterium]|nr:hypothetical protein [Candidatus Sumerlaeaceae bacterium]